MERFRKYADEITVEIDSGLDDSDEFKSLTTDLEECQKMTSYIVSSLAELDESIRMFKEDFKNAALDNWGGAKNAFSYALESKTELGSGIALAAGAIQTGAAALFGAVSFIGSKIQERRLRKQEKKMGELLVEKAKLARVKLPEVQLTIERLQKGTIPRAEKLYQIESGKTIPIDSSLFDKYVAIFRKSFCIVLKCRFLMQTLQYCDAEMHAWLNGHHDSDYRCLTYSDFIDREVKKWSSSLCGTSNVDQCLTQLMGSKMETVPAPFAFLFSDPAMFRHYVGVNFERVGNCDTALLACRGDGTLRHNGIYLPDGSLQGIIRNNAYFNSCCVIAEEYYRYPAVPGKRVFRDICNILFTSSCPLILNCFIFEYVEGTFLRILIIIGELILWRVLAGKLFASDSIGETLSDTLDAAEEQIPSVKRLRQYKQLCKNADDKMNELLGVISKNTIKI